MPRYQDPLEAEYRQKVGEGPALADQMAEDMAQMATGYYADVLSYGVIEHLASQIPGFHNVIQAIKWSTNPKAELKKWVVQYTDRDPDNLTFWKPNYVEHLVGKGLVGAVGGSAKGVMWVTNMAQQGKGALSSEDIRSAVGYEAAEFAESVRRNPTKIIVKSIWDAFVRGDLWDAAIYNKNYLFYYDPLHDDYAHFRAKGLRSSFNQWLGKYGYYQPGEELKRGAHPFFAYGNTEKGHVLVPVLKWVKAVHQVAVPALVTSVVFPPAAPLILAAGILNIDWRAFKQERSIKVPVAQVEVDAWRNQERFSPGEEARGFKDSTSGTGFSKIERLERGRDGVWYLSSKIDFSNRTPRNRGLDFLTDFGTAKGLYNTIIHGRGFESRGWSSSGHNLSDEDYRNLINQILYDKELQRPGQMLDHYHSRIQGADGVSHTNFNAKNNSFVYSQERIAPKGFLINGKDVGGKKILTTLFKDEHGHWTLSKSITLLGSRDSGSSKVWRVLYYAQQIATRIGAPIYLAVLVPNPIVITAVSIYVFRNIGRLTEGLKSFGWNAILDTNANHYVVDFGKAAFGHTFVFFKESGDGVFQRLGRFAYQLFHPFDRDVGILRGLTHAADSSWKAVTNSGLFKGLVSFINAHPTLKRVLVSAFGLLKKIPGFGYLVRFVMPFAGFAFKAFKWISSPREALKEMIRDYFKRKAMEGFWNAVKFVWRKWFAKKVSDWLLKQATKLFSKYGSKNLLGRFLNWLSKQVLGKPAVPKAAKGVVEKAAKPITNFLKDVLSKVGEFLKKLLAELWKLLKELLKILWQVAQRAIDALVNLVGDGLTALAPIIVPIILIVLGIIGVILLVLLIIALVTFIIGSHRLNQSPIGDGYLYIEKQPAIIRPFNSGFRAGDTVPAIIRLKALKEDLSTVRFEDYFLTETEDELGNKKYLFDPASITCTGVNGQVERAEHEFGPEGVWYRFYTNDNLLFGPQDQLFSLRNNGIFKVINCKAKVDDRYTGGELVDHAVVSSLSILEAGHWADTHAASQYLYLNSDRPSLWPSVHGCIAQGPYGLTDHQGRNAIDITTDGPFFNLEVISTVNGYVDKICRQGTYTTNQQENVCGGLIDKTQVGSDYGTYVVVNEPQSRIYTLYANLINISPDLVQGKSLAKGDLVGWAGSPTGNSNYYFHYEILNGSGQRMLPSYIPYFVPQCSGTSPDPTCSQAFQELGFPARTCFAPTIP